MLLVLRSQTLAGRVWLRETNVLRVALGAKTKTRQSVFISDFVMLDLAGWGSNGD